MHIKVYEMKCVLCLKRYSTRLTADFVSGPLPKHSAHSSVLQYHISYTFIMFKLLCRLRQLLKSGFVSNKTKCRTERSVAQSALTHNWTIYSLSLTRFLVAFLDSPQWKWSSKAYSKSTTLGCPLLYKLFFPPKIYSVNTRSTFMTFGCIIPNFHILRTNQPN